MKFACLTYSLSKEHMWSIHRDGCKDIKRDANEHSAYITYVEGNINDAMNSVLDEEVREMGWTEDAVKIHNCCKKGE
jgi:hypothetical protein